MEDEELAVVGDDDEEEKVTKSKSWKGTLSHDH